MRTVSLSFAALTGLAVILMSVLIPQAANATLVQASSRAALGSNLTINWGVFGPAGTTLSCACDKVVGPLDVHINGSSGELDRFDEGTDCTGNFAVGDQLLSQPFLSDEMTIGFSTPVDAVGTQIQPLYYIGSFTGFISVLTNDGANAVFSVSGNSTAAEDNSAPFIGVTSTVADITGVRFFADIGNPAFPREGAIAINQLDVDVPIAVPEPKTMALFMAATLAVLFVSRRKHR
jgi:hypothetical protein